MSKIITPTFKRTKECIGYSVYCLDAPYFFTQGDTKEEMIKNIIEVTEWWLRM